jgi:hypothetical protein
LLTQVERRFQDSPLSAIGNLLGRTLTALQASAQAGFTPPESVDYVVTYTSSVLDSLPSSFGERYAFDARFLASLLEDCSQGGAQFSPMLIPKPSDSWGHQTVVPSPEGKSAFTVDVILLPGEDDLNDVDLREYPFACHELGHNALFKQGDVFCSAFSQTLDDVVNALHRQTLALQGSGKQITAATIEQIRTYWTPTANHKNWAHEIAVDVIALWICGPAYLAALKYVLEQGETDPYQLGQSHPPYEVRAKAMTEAANQLGWAYYTGDYQALIEFWPKSSWAAGRTNVYAACADARLVTGSVTAALDTCRALGLPQCSPATIAGVREKLARQELPDLAVEILVAAWARHDEGNEDAYLEWERTAIRGHLDSLTE